MPLFCTFCVPTVLVNVTFSWARLGRARVGVGAHLVPLRLVNLLSATACAGSRRLLLKRGSTLA